MNVAKKNLEKEEVKGIIYVTIGNNYWGEEVDYINLVFLQPSTINKLDNRLYGNPHIKVWSHPKHFMQ